MPTLVGVFDAPGPVRTLADKIKGRSLGELEIYSPSPFPEPDAAIDKKPSRVRLFTLIGGLTGVTFGYWMQIWMANDWPLVIGGKPFTSVVPYTIIGFEMTILLGGLLTVLGLFVVGRLPRFRLDKGYSPRFSGEEIGLAVTCRDRDVAEVEALMRDSEAKEVTLVDA